MRKEIVLLGEDTNYIGQFSSIEMDMDVDHGIPVEERVTVELKGELYEQ